MSKQVQVSKQIFRDQSEVEVRSVALRKDDPLQAHREKIAKVILDDMYQFVGLLDVDGTLIEVNRAALEGAGIRLEDIQGKPFWHARWWQVSPETSQRQKEVCALAAQGEFVRYDVEIYGSNGGDETIIVDYSLFPVRDNAGRVVFLLAEGRNITEKKKADAEIARKSRELEQLLARVQELDEIKSRFFANVSHELRTPLALIAGPAEKILREGNYLQPLHRRDIQVIKRNASTLLKHVNDLLDISKLDADKMTVNYAAVDLVQLLRIIGGHFETLAADRDLRYVLDTPADLPAEVDPDKIERIVLNLLSNAFKFTPAGGRIKLAIQPLENRERTLIQVQDSGPGVKPEDRQAIFERFQQVDAGASRQFGGTGLGLSIAKDFARLHDGAISVTDAPGGGALFQVEIPLKAPEGRHIRRQGLGFDAEREIGALVTGTLDELRTVSPEVASEAPQARLPGRPTVLVVEDNIELNRFIVENLEEDYNVIAGFNGNDGLARALEAPPDLIVTDIMMPGMSGDQMIERVRQERALDQVPILVLSAKADDELRLRLLENGAQDYVVKPFASSELRARVRNLVEMKRARVQLEVANQLLLEKAHIQSSALAQSEAKFRTITNAVPQMVWSSLPDGYTDYFSAQWYEFTGMPEGSTDGNAWMDVVHTDDRECVSQRWSHSVLTGEDYEVEFRLRHYSGQYRWVLVRALPVRAGANEIVRWMGTCTDIHDQKQAQEALHAASRRKDEFVAMLAHELRNPLAPISAAAELLRRPGADVQLVRQAANVIIRQVGHMTGMVDDLLDVSRITRGLVPLEMKLVDVNLVVAGAIEQARPLIEQRRHTLSTRLAAQDAVVCGDQLRLVQAVTNTLVNAAKYTAPGGEITVELAVQAGQVRISVTDNGCGIEPVLLPHVFELFTQGVRGPDRSDGGLGLGLALAKGIMLLHEGEIEAHSEGQGKGSTFTFRLPLADASCDDAANTQESPQLDAAGTALRIMVVDDNKDAGGLLGMLLETLGHEVTVKEDARKALEAATAYAPHVFILDIGLPEVDGYELARRLRARPETGQALFIALTGYGQAHDKVLAKAAGFDHHFVKPVDMQRLNAVLSLASP